MIIHFIIFSIGITLGVVLMTIVKANNIEDLQKEAYMRGYADGCIFKVKRNDDEEADCRVEVSI